jgi:predicted nucleic acid-binding protein
MSLCVVDSSFAASWILPDEKSSDADELLAEYEAGQADFAQPEQWFYELLNLLWVARRRNRLGDSEVADAFTLLQRINVRSYPLRDIAVQKRVWDLAQKHQLAIYDAAYLELALRLSAVLCVNDASLKSAALVEGLQTI